MRATLFVFALVAFVLAEDILTEDRKCPGSQFAKFDCPAAPPPPNATNVRQLRPGNIAAVMALGDSITAGFAMKGGVTEYRPFVYSAGGAPGALTIGNFIKHYNPSVRGLATHNTVPLTKKGAGLNFAVSGAKVKDVPAQVDALVAKLKGEYKDVMDEWKLLTLFIGANDICSCHSTNPEVFETRLHAALDKVHKEVPKVFVNVMTIFNISAVWDAAQTSRSCRTKIPVLKECGCLNKNETDRQRMDNLAMDVNAATRRVVAQFAALHDPSFMVVNQPGVDNMPFNTYKNPEDYLSDLDCFHPSLCSDQAFAVLIWNNMWVPPAKKLHSLDPDNKPTAHCPGEDEFIQ